MDCKAFLEQLDAYLDGECNEKTCATMLSHAQNCAACRRALDESIAIHAALSHLNDGLTVPIKTQAKWRAAVRREAGRKKRTLFYRTVSAVAAAFVLLAGITAAFRSTGIIGAQQQVTPMETVHIQASGYTGEYYDLAATNTVSARSAFLEADGVSDIAGDAYVAPESADSSLVTDVASAKEKVLARGAIREMYAEDFDSAHSGIVNLVDEYNGVVVSDALETGKASRRAVLAIDVPDADLDAFLSALDFIGTVTYQEQHTEDLTESYYDARGRMESLNAQKDQLLTLLSQAQQADEVAEINAQLEEIYAEIDTLTGKINGYESRIQYARVDVALNEGNVATITGNGTQAGAGSIKSSAESIGDFFSDMALSLIVIAPYAAIALAVVAIAWLVISKSAKRAHRDS